MKQKEYDKWFITGFINILVYTIKWIFLVLTVLTTGFTIGLLVIAIVKQGNVSDKVITFFMDVLTKLPTSEIENLTKQQGITNVLVAGVGYGFAISLTYMLGYIIINKFHTLFNSIRNDDMFTKRNVKLINDTLPLTLIYALTQPVIVVVLSKVTGVFNDKYINISGLTYVFVTFTLKLIFENGLQYAKSSKKYEKDSYDMKAKEEELDVELFKKDTQIKSLKEEIKVLKEELETKKTTKKETKKTTEKKETKKTTKKSAK